jgi:hypothetical protein
VFEVSFFWDEVEEVEELEEEEEVGSEDFSADPLSDFVLLLPSDFRA